MHHPRQSWYRRLANRYAPPVLLGMIDYYRFPKLRDEQLGPLNGQIRRRQIVDELFSKKCFTHIIETGTFRGVTTEYFSNIDPAISVYSVEKIPRNYGLCRMRFLFNAHINLFLGDSRTFLKSLIPTLKITNNQMIFVYLDAHWWDDLPLFGEIKILLESGLDMVVMIDDFEVPGDSGYLYDDYGDDKILTRVYLDPLPIKSPLFYPAFHSSDESGKRRGCVVFANGQGSLKAISSCSSLRVIDD